MSTDLSPAEADGCPAVQFSSWGVVRCTKHIGHRGHGRGDGATWHSGSGQMVGDDGEPDVFGAAWRYMLELTR